jgi:hypothetical protein
MRELTRRAGKLCCVFPLAGFLALPAAALEPPPPGVLDLALRAYRCAHSRGEVSKPTLALIDYALPSTEKRLWLIDTDSGHVLQQELVAHGRGSGELFAEQFSNEPSSYQSSLGLFIAKDSYVGKHGLSLRLQGLEPGINDQADARAIVMHGASYVSEAHVARWGRLGRSLGCPALDPGVTAGVIERLRGGAAVFAYAADPDFLRRSPYLRCDESQLPTRVAAARQGAGLLSAGSFSSSASRP